MDDVMGKLTEILSDEESVKQLSELARMLKSGELGGDEVKNSTSSERDSSDCDNSAENSDMPDLETIMKLTSLAGAFNSSDKNTELLLALRPHLGEEKQRRVDKAVKLLKLIAVYNAAKESGLLNDMF